jgi:eukaryotic-like serine/threonine-protein kinase
MFDVHAAVAPLPGSTKARQLITSEALGYLDRLAASPSAGGLAPALGLELAQGYRQIAVIQGDPARTNLGDRQGALTSARRALTLLEPMRGAPAFARDASIEIAKLNILIGDIEAALGRKDLAMAARRTALKEAEALVSRTPNDDDARRLLASAYFSLALGLGISTTEALQAWERAGAIFEALLAEQPDDADRRRNVALVNKYIGGWHGDRKQFDQAERHYRRAMEIDEQTLAAKPTDRRAQFDVSIDLANVGTVQANRGVKDDAIQSFERSVALREARVKSDPADVQAQVSLARAFDMLAHWRLRFGDRVGARRDAERAIEIVEPLTAKSGDSAMRTLLENARRLRSQAAGPGSPVTVARPATASRQPSPAAR